MRIDKPDSKTLEIALNLSCRKSLIAPAAEQLRAAQKCSQTASCPCAICETALCAGSGCPACGRKQLQPPTPVAVAPTTNLYRGSNDSVRQECVERFQTPAWPISSRGARRAHSRGTAQGSPQAPDASCR